MYRVRENRYNCFLPFPLLFEGDAHLRREASELYQMMPEYNASP
jgi:hypothetical protein